MLRAFIFDCDGVLADNENAHRRAFEAVLRDRGVPVTPDVYGTVLGQADADVLRGLLAAAGQDADEATIESLRAAKEQSYAASLATSVVPVPGVREFVRGAAAEYRIAVASGATRPEVDSVLDRLDIGASVEAIVTIEDCTRGKPDPEPFLRALTALNAADPAPVPPIEARECLVFEDSLHGVAAAQAAGMRVVALTTTLAGADLRDADLVAAHFRALDWRRLTAFFDRRAR